jgi:anti-anti-sigma factor
MNPIVDEAETLSTQGDGDRMKTEIFLDGGRLLVRIEGRFILDECDALKEALQSALIPAVSHVVVDLAGTEFIDSAGLGTLVRFKMQANQIKARMTLANPSAAVAEVLSMSKLNEIFEIASGDETMQLVSDLSTSGNLLRRIGGEEEAESAAPPVQSAADLKIEEAEPKRKAPNTNEFVEEICRSAVEALRRGNYEESIRFYRQALEMNSDYLPARNNLAIVFEKRPEWRDQAIEQWEIVLRLSEETGDTKHKQRAEKHLRELRA